MNEYRWKKAFDACFHHRKRTTRNLFLHNCKSTAVMFYGNLNVFLWWYNYLTYPFHFYRLFPYWIMSFLLWCVRSGQRERKGTQKETFFFPPLNTENVILARNDAKFCFLLLLFVCLFVDFVSLLIFPCREQPTRNEFVAVASAKLLRLWSYCKVKLFCKAWIINRCSSTN